MMQIPDFPIAPAGPVSQAFLALGCSRFDQAALHVRELPYGRLVTRGDFLAVLREGRGTCSGKHALLATLAEEQRQPVELWLGFFRQVPENSPRIAAVLNPAGLAWYPELHCYLKWQGQRLDFTGKGVPIDPKMALFDEQQIVPAQIETYKTDYHRRYLPGWIEREGLAGRFDAESLWKIREACINARSGRG